MTPLGALALVGRILLFLVLMVLAIGLPQGLTIEILEPRLGDPWAPALGAVVTVVAIYLVTRLMRALVDRRPWGGMALPRPQWRLLAAGFAFGGVLMLLVCAIQYGLGWISPIGSEVTDTGWLLASGAILGSLIGMLGVGFSEELAMRGYLFQTMGERMPIWLATGLSGAIFGGLHAGSGGFGWEFVASALVITATFVVFRLVTGSLWFPIGYHAAWNWVQYSVVGVSNVNDREDDQAFVEVAQSGPRLWTGEAPSIEGGLLVILLNLLILVALLLYARRRRVDWGARLDPQTGAPVPRDGP